MSGYGPTFGNGALIQRCDDLFANLKPPSDEVLASVRRLVEGQEDAEALLQMLGLEPYESAPYGVWGAHGTVRRYRSAGCRCDPCKAAGRAKVIRDTQRLREGRSFVTTHNRWGYRRGCRCYRCRADYREYERTRDRGAVVSHGRAGYRKGCRCPVCREADNSYHRDRRANKRGAAA